jgi:hypothetical protein
VEVFVIHHVYIFTKMATFGIINLLYTLSVK